MRTSLNEIRQAESYLSGEMKPAESLLFYARLLVNPRLRKDLAVQEKLYRLIRFYGRKKLKQEITEVEHALFSQAIHNGFREEINNIFT